MNNIITVSDNAIKQIKKIIVIYNKKDSKRVKSLKLKNIRLLTGGNSRQQSTYKALKYLNKKKRHFSSSYT